MMTKFLSPDLVFHVSRDVFEREVKLRFGDDVELIPSPDDFPDDVTALVQRAGEPLFQVFHDRDGESMSTDGTDDQAAEVALWIRSLLPDDPLGRIWMTDEGLNGHVELVPGMTVEDLRSGWVDHEDEPVVWGQAVEDRSGS